MASLSSLSSRLVNISAYDYYGRILTGNDTTSAPCFAASLISFTALDRFEDLFDPTANCISANRNSEGR